MPREVPPPASVSARGSPESATPGQNPAPHAHARVIGQRSSEPLRASPPLLRALPAARESQHKARGWNSRISPRGDAGERVPHSPRCDRAAAPEDGPQPGEAAEALGVSRDFLDEHILPGLRVVRVGRKVLVPLSEIEKWLDKNAALTLG